MYIYIYQLLTLAVFSFSVNQKRRCQQNMDEWERGVEERRGEEESLKLLRAEFEVREATLRARFR